MEPFLGNTLRITIQPKQNFHFRYLRELKDSHGVLIGQEPLSSGLQCGTTKSSIECDPSPTIKLQLPANAYLDDNRNKRDFYVLCSLHSYFNNEPHSLSPHLLIKKGQTEKIHEFIFVKMEENPSDPCERTCQLKNYVILRPKMGKKFENYKKSLRQKQNHYQSLQLPLDFDGLKGKLDINDPESLKISGVLNVCLGFTIFEKDFYQSSYSLYKETIHSHNIFHGDDLNIHRLCNTKGKVSGGLDVTLLMKLSSGYNYNIHMVYMDPKTGATIWEHTQPVNPKNIFCNAALTFELPKGPHVPGVKEFEVKLEIVVGTSTYKSQSVPFSYINIRENFLSLRRRHWVDNNETFATKATNGSFLFNAMNPPYGCRLISDSNYINEEFDYALNTYASRDTVIKKTKTLKVPNGESNKEISINKDVEFENTSFHEAIMDCELRYNLLHYACFHNKAIAIKPLVELGCGLQEQDLEGRTPLHLAIEYARKECILEFEHLLENYQQYPKAVVKKLIEMFYVYDNLGHTIVHAAVMARLTTLFEAMLKFCHSHCMNITRCGILGNGDSVIHLIVKRNLIDMAPLLKEYIPTFLTIKNYAGQTALDLDDLSMQMFELLHDEITKKKKN